jgi:hypothetical protein
MGRGKGLIQLRADFVYLFLYTILEVYITEALIQNFMSLASKLRIWWLIKIWLRKKAYNLQNSIKMTLTDNHEKSNTIGTRS